ncbi:MAG: addiction module protein [Limisphaerales bacterium]
MSTTALKVCVEALSLPREARADLAHRLLVSLEDEAATPAIEDAWKATAERRYDRLKRGKTTARDAKLAVREARKRLAK